MQSHVTIRTINRSRWLSDLTTALTQAERLLILLETDGNYPEETVRLRRRIQMVRAELDLLNRAIPSDSRIVGPTWPTRNVEHIELPSKLHSDWLPRRD